MAIQEIVFFIIQFMPEQTAPAKLNAMTRFPLPRRVAYVLLCVKT